MEVIIVSAAHWMLGVLNKTELPGYKWQLELQCLSFFHLYTPSLKMTIRKREDINPEDRKKRRGVIMDEKVQQISIRLKGAEGVSGTYFAE